MIEIGVLALCLILIGLCIWFAVREAKSDLEKEIAEQNLKASEVLNDELQIIRIKQNDVYSGAYDLEHDVDGILREKH